MNQLIYIWDDEININVTPKFNSVNSFTEDKTKRRSRVKSKSGSKRKNFDINND